MIEQSTWYSQLCEGNSCILPFMSFNWTVITPAPQVSKETPTFYSTKKISDYVTLYVFNPENLSQNIQTWRPTVILNSAISLYPWSKKIGVSSIKLGCAAFPWPVPASLTQNANPTIRTSHTMSSNKDTQKVHQTLPANFLFMKTCNAWPKDFTERVAMWLFPSSWKLFSH